MLNISQIMLRIEGKINDALTKEREKQADQLKSDERKEVGNMGSNEVLSHAQRLKQKFNFTQ